MKIILSNLSQKIQKIINIDNAFMKTSSQQKKFMSKLKICKNDIDRSFNQYKCQMFFVNRFIRFFLNIFSFIFVIFSLMKKNDKLIVDEPTFQNTAIFYSPNRIPKTTLPLDEIQKSFNIVTYDKEEKFLSKEDKKFIFNIYKKHPFSFLFIYRILEKIKIYSYIIKSYSPTAIITTAEYSFTSSVLTMYCEKNNVSHINSMHGIKLFFIRDSYFRFTLCYVWDSFFAKLFADLNADKNQFKVCEPSFLIAKKKSKLKYDFKYYLQNETLSELKTIACELSKLKENGYTVCYRSHPRYENINTCKILECFDREDNQISISDSLLNTKYIISRYSTVLYEGYLNNKEIVIDDITNKKEFNQLIDKQFIMLNKKHYLLSEIVNLANHDS